MKLTYLIVGQIAEEVLHYLLTNFEGEGRYRAFPITGYFREGDKYTCFDNTSWCCFVEQANSEVDAITWCLGGIDATDLYNWEK